jgi:hypothetical protein
MKLLDGKNSLKFTMIFTTMMKMNEILFSSFLWSIKQSNNQQSNDNSFVFVCTIDFVVLIFFLIFTLYWTLFLLVFNL